MTGGEIANAEKLTGRLSTATPWSLPVSFTSNQRKKTSCPAGTTTPDKTTFVNTSSLAGLLPSGGVAVRPVVGVVKSSPVNAVQLFPFTASEFVIGLLLTRYEKASFWAFALPPLRHS